MVEPTFLSKTGLVAQQIAREALLYAEGERIPTTQTFGEKFHVGSGTVQRAIRDLETAGAIALRTRGHQGTLLVSRSVSKLWKAAGLGTAMGSMPLPYSREFQGLATGIRGEFERLAIPFSMLYCHGGRLRLKALLDGRIDFLIASRHFARRVEQEHANLKQVVELGPGTYYANDSVVVVTSDSVRDPAEASRIGIDRGSGDHERLTKSEFPDREYTDVSYVDIPAAIQRGAIDAAVWHRTMLTLSLEQIGLRVFPLRRGETMKLTADMGAAVLIAEENAPIRAVLGELDVKEILNTQTDVVGGEARPVF